MIPVISAKIEAAADPIPSPRELGLPAKFHTWRPVQIRAINDLAHSRTRFDVPSVPTGAGKSSLVLGYAAMFGMRVIYLTSTKALQDQVHRDFESVGAVTLKGMNAYHCNLMDTKDWYSCDHGPCLAGVQCPLRASGCAYFDAIERAKHAPIVVTNYALWMRLPPDALGNFDLLVADEGHAAVDWCCQFLSTTVNIAETRPLRLPNPPASTSWQAWALWAKAGLDALEPLRKDANQTVVERAAADPLSGPQPGLGMSKVYEIKVMQRKLEMLSKGLGANWVIDEIDNRGIWKIDPLTPAGWTEKLLWKGIGRVVLLSATVRPKTAALLGLKPHEFTFREYSSDFPVERRPVYYLPSALCGRDMGDDEWANLMARLDQIIASRPNRRGIIHAVSYERARRIAAQSANWKRLITHDRTNQAQAIERYLSRPDAVIVSPSLTTGWDFPDKACEFMVIVKLPFADSRPAIERARRKHDRQWSLYSTMQEIVQMAGRGSRHRDDLCETFILDANWGNWFLPACHTFAPKYFLAAVRETLTVPSAPDPLPDVAAAE